MPGKRAFWLLIPLVLLVAGCLPQPTLRSELFLDDLSLVSGEPCGAPCWNGITAGETTWQEAIDLIENDEAFTGLDSNAEQGILQAVWQRVDTDQYCCRFLAEAEDGPLTYLFLALAPGMIVDQVLEAHGEPAYVTTFDFTDAESVVQMIYPDVPMVVSVLVGDSTGAVLANSEVVAVLYMAPDEMDLVLDTTELQGWNGYQSYQAYKNATPVVTPIYTLTPPPTE